MRRLTRRTILCITWATPFAPWIVSAQQAGRSYRVGYLSGVQRAAPNIVALFDEVRRSGFIEGQNLTVDGRGFGARSEQFPSIAAELVRANADVIVCAGDAAIHALQQATATIPILAITDDMVGSGLVRSLASPGGNTTGVSLLATELDGKRQEVLMELVPGVRRMAALADTGTTAPRQLQTLQDLARTRGVELSIYPVARPEEIVASIDAAQAAGATVLNVLASPLLFANGRNIIERTNALRLPAVFQWPEMAEQGGVVAYGPSIVRIFREQIARQLVKLLRGTKPADIPVEQPTKFDLVINLKTAKSLGLTIPESFLLRADEVIE
jgi:putative tryptophan/tyrosine transport system substrate-binding protein